MRSDFAQDDMGERPFQFPWSWRRRQFVKELFAVELYPGLMFGISQEFPDAPWLQSASSGSFDYVVACAPTSLKMTWGKGLSNFGGLGDAGNSLRNCLLLNLPSLMFGISQKFPCAASLQSASSGSFDYAVACAPTSLKMTSGILEMMAILTVRFGSFSLLATMDGTQKGNQANSSIIL